MNDKTTQTLDRRRFLGHSAAFAAAPLAISSRAHAGENNVLKVGLIGCGGRGSGAAMQALRADPQACLWALGDLFEDRLARGEKHLVAAAAKLDGRPDAFSVSAERRFFGFDAFKKVIDSGVDVVLLATPTYFRPEHLAYAVSKKKHVFCEKPVAVDAPGIRSVMASAKVAAANGTSIISGFCWRYKENDRAFVRELRDGRLGDIQAVYTRYLATPLVMRPREKGWTDLQLQFRNWQFFNWLSGDHVVEQAVHSIDKIHWFKNEVPTKVTALGGRAARPNVEEAGDVFDHFSATFDFKDGSRAFHIARQMANCNYDNSDSVIGTLGRAEVDSWGPKHIIKGKTTWRGERRHLNDMYQQEHDELFAAIRAGKSINQGEDLAKSTLMALMVRDSAYSGNVVHWDKALASDVRVGPQNVTWETKAPVISVPIPGAK